MTENRLIELEIKAAYQEDLVQTLSDIVASQQQRMDNLERAYNRMHERVNTLSAKLPEDFAQHEIPPHY